MTYLTTIDTVTLQIDLVEEERRNSMLEEMLALLHANNLYVGHKDHPIGLHSNFFIREYQAYSNNVVIASIRAGSYSIKNPLTSMVVTTYYITMEFAGLSSYHELLNTVTRGVLLKLVAYCNSRNITFKLTGCDIAIDMFTKFDNVLALCTKKSPKTAYWIAGELQFYDTTTYIENIPYSKLEQAVQRAYLYDKALKDGLAYPLTRFEVKLQPKFFNKNKENIILGIANALDKYHVMYVPNKRDKQYLIEQYNANHKLGQRGIKKLGLDKYRCHPDITAVVAFINQLFTVQEDDLLLITQQ